jgi:hypothetical protein
MFLMRSYASREEGRTQPQGPNIVLRAPLQKVLSEPGRLPCWRIPHRVSMIETRYDFKASTANDFEL